jgi:hypothetical protein
MAKSIANFYPSPVFIGGTGRSGTTIVGDLLNEHPQIRTSLPTEIKFLANPGGLLDITFGRLENPDKPQKKLSILNYRTYQKRGIREKARFDEFFNLIWNKWWQIDAPPPHGRGLSSGISKEKLESLLKSFKKSYRRNRVYAANQFILNLIKNQDLAGQELFWVETTPLSIANATRILKIVPNAKFINMMRDPRDVISSLLTKNWGPNTPLEGIEWIEKRIIQGHTALQAIPSDLQLTIRLEDLVMNDRFNTYNKLLEFLGLKDCAEMQIFFDSKITSIAASTGRWKSEIADPIFDNHYKEMLKRLQNIGVNTYPI